MATIKVLAGDFLEGDGSFTWGVFTLKTNKYFIVGEGIRANQVETFDIATEENVKKIGGTIGWGAAGAALFGPVGLLAGLLLGGKRKEIIFVVKFKDSRKLVASCDTKTYAKIQAAVLKNPIKETVSPSKSINPESNKSDEIEKLIKLGDMLNKGLITEEEFKKYKEDLQGSDETTHHTKNQKQTN